MMHPANIPLGHLYSNGVQPNVQYSPEQEEFIRLLTDKPGYLKEQQYGEIGRLMADVKQPELLAKLQPKALARIEKHKQDLMNLYKQQRDKRRLSDSGLLEADRLKRQLMFDLSSMRQLTKNFLKGQDDVSKYAASGHISPQEVLALQKTFYDNAADPNRGFGDIPFFSELLAQLVNPRLEKAKVEDAEKKFKEMAGDILTGNTGDQNTKPTYKEFMSKFDLIYPNDRATKLYGYAQQMGMIPQGADPRDIVGKSLYERIYPKERAAGMNINMGGGGDKNKSQMWNFDLDPNTGEYIGTPTVKMERSVRFKDGTVSDVRVIEQRTDPQTNETKWIIQRMIPKDPTVMGSTDSWGNAEVITETEEPSFGRLFKQRPEFVSPKMVVDNTKNKPAAGKTYRMQDALIQYQGYSEKQIRDAMSKLGYKEVK